MNAKTLITSMFSLLFVAGYAGAKGPSTSGGLTLLQASGARAAALGEAFQTAENDINAFHYNPASLSTLSRGHASFHLEKGIADDTFSQINLGNALKNGGWGVSIGYFSTGDFELFDGENTRTVTAKSDLNASLGMARNMGRMAYGGTIKYITSSLAETARANAFAADVGLSYYLNKNIQLGGAIQNFGTELDFGDDPDPLPRIARLGAAYHFRDSRYPSTLSLEAPYFINEQEFRPAIGFETNFGPLMVRAGYKSGIDLEEFSLGTGIFIGDTSLDYSFGLVDQLDSRHRVSFSFRFAGSETGPEFVRPPVDDRLTLTDDPYAPKDARIDEEVLAYRMMDRIPPDMKPDYELTFVDPQEDKSLQSPINKAENGANSEASVGPTTENMEINTPPSKTGPSETAPKNTLATNQTTTSKTQSRSKTEPRTSTSRPIRNIPSTYVIGINDTLVSIAKKFYGTGNAWTEIYDLNEKVINDFSQHTLIGREIRLPRYQDVFRPKVYIVQERDTLKSIAAKIYGNPDKWVSIYDANELIINSFSDYDLVGKKLVIP